MRVAIIGAGPSGFYAAGALLEQDAVKVSVDLFDRLPTPFGLVRDGVAPDHQKIKSVTRVYDRIASDARVRFFGNVTFGTDLTHDELRRYYDQVIYAVGASSDRKLGIPGEDLDGSYSATAFVGWYNGHPDYAGLDFDLSGENVAVVGIGNVAMDVARVLAKPVEALAKTDIADYALEKLSQSRVKRIYVLGRRGPAQAAFTNPELRELGNIEGAEVIVDPADLELDPHSRAAAEADRDIARNVETLHQYALREEKGEPRKIYLRFLVSPVEILGENGHVRALKLERNELQPTESGYLQAHGTGVYETIDMDAVFRAVGYRGVPLPGVPFDARKGTIPNQGGRVIDPETGSPIPGEYVVGWAKRGPTGIIGTNKPDAVETVRLLLEDVATIEPVDDKFADPQAAEAFIRARQPNFVSYADWRLLDQIEVSRGKALGRPRVKFSCVEEMVQAIAAARQGMSVNGAEKAAEGLPHTSVAAKS